MTHLPGFTHATDIAGFNMVKIKFQNENKRCASPSILTLFEGGKFQ